MLKGLARKLGFMRDVGTRYCLRRTEWIGFGGFIVDGKGCCAGWGIESLER